MTTMEKLEQIVDHTMSGKINYNRLLSPAPAPVKHAGRITRSCAWGILILLLAVPLLAAIAPKPNLLWCAWAAISVWAALDSRTIAAAMNSPKRPVVSGRLLVVGLALWNVLIAVYAAFTSSVPLR